MIQKFITRFDANREALKAKLLEKHPEDYSDLVKMVVEVIGDDAEYGNCPDPERIHKIDDGDYQGTLVFVIGATGYQPSTYWYTKVYYGSCSGCDTLQAISNYSSEPPTEQQASDYLTLALHILQNLHEMAREEDHE